MCDEREPLLAYLYDECDPVERLRVEAHLESCEGCRDELAGLRQVRQDLLAWDVPDHGSVWRPFTPARPAWSWHDVPAWTLAAAATVMLALGATGGVVASRWKPATDRAPLMQTVSAPMPVVMAKQVTPAVMATSADLAALEVRVSREIQERVRSVSPQTKYNANDYTQLLNLIVRQEQEISHLSLRVNNLSDTVTQMQTTQQGGQPGGR